MQGAQIAFMNPGGIRADLIYDNQDAGEAPGEVTFGEVFTVQPFQNTLVSMDLTGAQMDALLEQQFDNPAPGSMRVLQVSEGFSYEWAATAPTGNKVAPNSIMLNGAVIDPGATYRINANSFNAEGGAVSPLAPGPNDRVTAVS